MGHMGRIGAILMDTWQGTGFAFFATSAAANGPGLEEHLVDLGRRRHIGWGGRQRARQQGEARRAGITPARRS